MNYFKLKFLLLFFALAVAIPPAWAKTVTDVIDYNVTKDLIGNTGATAWADLKIEGQSGAKYVLHTMGNLNENQGICWNKNGYLYTTESPGKLKSVTFIGNTGTGNKRAVNIFAQNNAYTEKASGTYIKQVQFDNEGITYSFSDEYKYIAINGTASNTLINSISIEWEIEEGGETPQPADVTLSFPENSYTATLGQTFNAPTLSVDPAGAASEVTYSSSNTGVAMVDEETGAITLVAAGTTTITAEISGSDTYNNATASYTLTVEEAAQPGIITDFKETFTDCDGTGGNDNSWSGSIASNDFDDSNADNDGWTLVSGNAANACIKLGTGSALGSAETPEIRVTPGITYTLTFKAGAWDNSKESTTLKLSAEGGQLQSTTVTMTKGSWTEYTITFVATSETAKIKFQGNKESNSRFFLDEVRLTHDQNATPVTVVAKPEFSPATGTYTEAQTVTITCATEDAVIHYTVDGTDPTAESTPYTGAITISETTTLKAIAVKDGQSSAVAEATYTIKTVTSVANLQAANALDDDTEFIYTGEAVVVWRDGNQMWLQDPNANVGGALVYGNVVSSFSSKDKLKSGWTAKKGTYNNASQFTEFSAEKDGNQDASPFERTSISADNVHEYVLLKGVSISSDKKSLTFPGENGNTLTVYNKFNKLPETINATSTYDIKGIIVLFGGSTLEIYPLGYEEHSAAVVEVKAPEFTYNNEAITGSSVEVNANDKITITSEEGTTLIYTTDGSNPSESATALLTDGNTAEVTITEACTIKAVALDGDANESEVATLAVTISEPVQPGESRTYQKVTSTDQVTTGKYLIVYEHDNIAFDGSLETLDASNNIVEVTITDGEIETDKDIYFTYDATAQTLKSASNKYIGQSSYANGLKQDEDATKYTNSITIDDGNAVITALQSGNNNQFTTLRFNSVTGDTNYRFRYYKSGQQPIQLYKEVTGDVPVVTPVITVDHTQLTINDETGDAKTGTLTATVDPAAEITAETSTNMWTANVAENKVTYNGRALHETGTVTYKSEGATDVTANLEYNYTGPLYILGYVNGGDWSASNAVQMEGPSTEGLYTATFTTTPNANNQSEISFTKRKGSDWDKWSEIYDYRFVPVSNDTWVLADETTNVYCDLDFDPAHVDNQKIVMPAGKYTVTIDAKNNKFKIEPVIETVARPTFEPEPQEEAFTTVQNVTISCATEGATIHYTTDGSEPTAESPVYSEAIVVNDGTTTIKAIAIKEGMTNSEVASATYTVNLPTLDAPTFDHESKIYDGAFEVTITAAEGATIHYTTDGTDPTAESAVYKARIPVNKNMTIKAIAVKEGYKTSAVASAEYQIKVAKPTFSPVPGTFDAATTVSIACGTEGATIHYTTDGTTEPTAESPVYSQPIAVNSGTMTIKAIAIKEDMTNSDIAEGVYTIKQNAGLAFDPTTATAEAGAEEFNAPTLVNPNNLSPITYKSSDENVAAFVDGVLVIGDAGETTITATFAGNEEFNEGSASYTLTVTKKDAGLKYEQAELTVYAGNDFTAPTLVNPNKLSPITYSSNNENVAMVDEETGEVVLMDEIGNATITATFAGNGQYNEATASYTIHVIAKKTATLTFDPTQVTVYVGTEEITQPTLTTNPNNLSPITYSSDNDNVAMVDDKTGEVVLMGEIGNAKITATFAGNDEYAKAEASYTITVEAKPAIIVDFESLTMAAKVGETATATFNVLGTDLKEVVTLTLNDANGVYTINPESSISIKDAEEGATVTVTYKPTQAGNDNATITIASEAAESVTVTLAGTATVPEVVAMPTFSLVAGSYTGAQQVTIYCATEGATISYSTDGGQTWKEGNTVNVDKDMTIMAKAEKNGMTVSTTASATYVIITEETPETVNIVTGYYQIKNLGNGLYANVAGRKTLNFTDAPADKAGTVIYVDVENDGTVKSLRSQAADLQRYADRAMSYVPEVVKIVAEKLNADGSGEILGETGLEKILEKFNKCFDHNLHVEQAEGGYRLYGKTPSMQPVVEFYRENKDKVEAKLPNLEAFINSALEKLKAKIGGSSVFTEFKLHDIWDKMGGTLTEPVDAASTMAFYREVLNNKNYVWDFAYQTAMIYVNNLMNHPRWPEVEEYLGEYAQYIDKIKQIRPEFKYYIVQKDGKPDFISEGNKDIIDKDPRTIWSLEKRDGFTVNFPKDNKHNGEYVTTLYTDFAYTLPEGVTAYTVTEVSTQGVATLTALEGTIPAQTPVLLKSTAAGNQTVTLSTEAGTAPADNLLVGPDYLIKTYEIKTPQVEKIFEIIQNKLPGFYEEYVAQYEYLMLKTAGTVGNKYFWGLNKDEIIFDNNCVVRSLDVQDGTVAFYDNATVSTNKAFLVDDANNPQDVIKLSLRGDINKDGVISIIDVTALIDILLDLPAHNYLEPTDTYPKGLDYEAANVNENEEGIEITDVTTLIDILLNMPDQPAQGSGN